MSNAIPWTWNGPTNSSARLADYGASHVASLSITYPPCADARRAITDRAAREVADVLLAVTAGGPAVERYRRLAAALADAEARGAALADRLRDLRQEQEGAGANDDPNLARRLAGLARERRDTEAWQRATSEEIVALEATLKQARADAEEDLARQARQQAGVACRSLEARRSAELAEMLREVGERLTMLLALDEAILRARSGGTLRPSLDQLPVASSKVAAA